MSEQKKAKFWVTMTDRFLSGWGQAEGRVNKLVIECATWEEAEIVAANARNRSEMFYVNICIRSPKYSTKRVLVSYKTLDEMPFWRQAGAFKKG